MIRLPKERHGGNHSQPTSDGSPPRPMTGDAAYDHVITALLAVAPELSAGALDAHTDLRRELGLSSSELLGVLASEITGIDIPQSDHPRLASVAACTDYILERGGES